MLLASEHMLDLGADFGSPGVSFGDPLGHRLPRLAPLVDMALEHARSEERLVLLRPVGGICPYARAGVALADQVRQPRPVMGIGGTGAPCADQAVGLVDADMVLVAEHRDGEIDGFRGLGIGALADLGLAVLDRPARIAVLLSRLGRLPLLGHAPFLDRGLLGLGVRQGVMPTHYPLGASRK